VQPLGMALMYLDTALSQLLPKVFRAFPSKTLKSELNFHCRPNAS